MIDENRAQAYLQLIYTLLNFPNGEDSQILQDNLELLDLRFLQACEIIAATLEEDGEEDQANYLRNIASYLGEFIKMNDQGNRDNSEGENSQIYQEFIRELLQAEAESNSDIAVIYPMLAKREHLLNARFAEILQQVAKSLIADEDPEAIESIVAIIENLSIDISDFPRGNRANNIEIAITGYQIVLSNRQPGSEKYAQTQNNLANAYRNRIKGSRADNLERAIGFFEAALTVYTLEDFREDWAMTQNNLAAAYSDRIKGSRADNLESAIGFYEAALTVRTLKDFPFNNAQTLSNLGLAYLAKLDYINREKPEDTNQRAATINSAYDTFKNAITGATNLRKLESGDETKQKHDLQWDRLYRGMVQVCLDRDSNQEALEYAEANKARNLAEVIAQKQEIPETLKPIAFSEITQLLTPNTALIEWYITDEEIITFVLTYPDVLTVHRSRQWDELMALVDEYRADYKKSIKEKNTHWQTQLAAYLQRLAEILQITTILPSESTRLILIPHWLLHLFPLHALPLSEGEFLLDRFTQGIQYAPSCQLLQQITIHPNFDQLLALQNPTEDLDFADVEVTSIAPKFAISQIIAGAEASKINLLEKYLEQLKNAHCAHFSCHGSFNADDPLKSYLILSGGIITKDPSQPLSETPEEKDRYVAWREGKTADIDKCLTLAEIFGLRLKQCRLVVLSACETALIDTENRSDYIGLPTGFLYAGAMGTLASLWPVNDLSTALIMIKFYEVLQPGVSIGKALHDTQQWFKSAMTPDLLEWVEGSDSFDGEQKEGVTEYLERYELTVKPYGDVYHWGAFCAIGL